ncbi:hypothetical protein GLAREA_08631 [Glarea lozoyensis ATCC 20868]|uniref:Uncharacterized protein n=1 Tax=Glarea lozoyensis (strain ATCC 20868 / MF5171) TaxID=1116229 RepID=S3DDS8_GLAL2|nr:uncharacterized protein GLAREA_08631 [Glarea lozoyensis ATCC 20868]EPE24778.1 hypothetical protein GLAREA_08631 [Glarea lozoyensis ATCC 20868]
MSVYLEKKPVFSLDNSRSATESIKSAVVQYSNINTRGTIDPKNVGILPLHVFIYIIIGVLVTLCCSVSIWEILKTLISARRFISQRGLRMNVDAKAKASFRQKRARLPGRVATIAKREVGKYRTQPMYQADGFLDPTLMAKPNLPLPVVQKETHQEQPEPGLDVCDIETWSDLVKEKSKLDIAISNWERVSQAQTRAGQPGANHPRLLATLQRRTVVENLINATFERFKEKRGEWSTQEWQVIEQIMQYQFQ